MQVSAVHASFPVILGGAIVCFVVFQGHFDSNLGVSTGAEEYAEKPDPLIYGQSLIDDVKFPANAVVNVLYTVIGTYWVMQALLIDYRLPEKASTTTWRPSKKLLRRFSSDAFMAAVFGWMGVLYGPVQFLRISTQSHDWAVLDQWFTLPFFSWAFCWILYCLKPSLSKWWFLPIELVSLASYGLTFLSPLAFDAALGVHILTAVSGGIHLIRKNPERKLWTPFLRALCCCVGFVVLKLGDHWLAETHRFFTVLSGHFWSKICDALQIHFVCAMFFKFNAYDYEKMVGKKEK